jgi:hypothetical protein
VQTSINNSREGRAIEYFRRCVAPVLSGQFSHYFWMRLVNQVSEAEPAVRHAVIAISSIYEHFDSNPLPLLESESGQFAVAHYNQALRHLATKSMDESLVLLTCILFICIESLRDNHHAAIDHCRHGIMILNGLKRGAKLARDDLLPIFVRLSIFPFFFGGTVDTFPGLSEFGSFSLTSFANIDDARYAMDVLSTRTIRFVRSVSKYRMEDLYHEPIPESVITDQQIRLESIRMWRRTWARFRAAHPPTQDDIQAYAILEMKSCVALIWTGVALDRTEMSYDQYTAVFQELLNGAWAVQDSQMHCPVDFGRRQYIFEMGFTPLLYFVVFRCRVLSLRLAALDAMMSLSASRETLWDSALMYAMGRRVIEIEHGIDDFDSLQGWTSFDAPVPPDEMRIRDTVAAENVDIRDDGMICRRTTFFVWSPTEIFDKREEVIAIQPSSPIETAWSPIDGIEGRDRLMEMQHPPPVHAIT